MRDDPVHRSLRAITTRLERIGVPYAVVGGMALVAHGYYRTTTDVDILVTPEGMASIHGALEGLGYIRPTGTRTKLRDTDTKVLIEFLITGGFPGDGKPKPVAFPDPAAVAVEIDGIRYVGLPTLLELKLASGMSNLARAKDIGDAVELIRALDLDRDFGDSLDPFVRGKYLELWDAVDADRGREP